MPRPYLLIRASSPTPGKTVDALALIDTGADECSFPVELAAQLGHTIDKGKPKTVLTGAGPTTVYSHSASISFDGFTVADAIIDFNPRLRIPLLGVKSFLSNFVLTVDYPAKTFSLSY
ncbi:MAG: aspartyl protease family protein [Candidatus Coatesbacteria bacterium]